MAKVFAIIAVFVFGTENLLCIAKIFRTVHKTAVS